MTHIAQEPRDKISKNDGLVGLVVVGWSRDPSEVPQIPLPLIESRVRAAGVEKQDVGCALDEPASV